ncbi:MAG: MFS transporter, partial [Thermoanaerobaculia bacterium]
MSPLRRLGRSYARAFSGLPGEVWILAVATLVNRAGTMVLPFLTLYLTGHFGWSPASAGRMLALYGAGAIGGAFLGGWAADRWSPIAIQQLSLIGTGIGFLALTQISSEHSFGIAMVLISLVAESYRPALLAAAGKNVPAEVRGRSMGLLRLAVNAGMSIGPALGGLLAGVNYDLLFVADACTCWAAAVVLFLARRPAPVEIVTASDVAAVGSPWRDGPFVLFLGLAMVMAIVFFQINGTFPLYLHKEYGLSEAKIGGLLGLNALIVVACEMLILHRVERRAPLSIIGPGAFLVCLGFALLPLGRGALFAAATIAVWTVGEMLALPMTNVFVAARAGSARAGRYMGAYTMAFATAFLIAPALGLSVYDRFGGNVLWGAAGVVGAVLWLGFWALGRVLASRSFRTPTFDPAS